MYQWLLAAGKNIVPTDVARPNCLELNNSPVKEGLHMQCAKSHLSHRQHPKLIESPYFCFINSFGLIYIHIEISGLECLVKNS